MIIYRFSICKEKGYFLTSKEIAHYFIEKQ